MDNTTYSHINLEYLELMADGDTDMKNTMLEMLLDELPSEIDKLKQAASQGDMKQLAAVSHKLKSTLSFVGNPVLDKTNKKVEKMAKGELDASPLNQHLQTIEETYQLVLPEIKQALAGN